MHEVQSKIYREKKTHSTSKDNKKSARENRSKKMITEQNKN